MINCRITFKNKLQAIDTGPKRPALQGNNFLCSLSLHITHPSLGHQFQLFTCCQVYFQVSTFLLCHCIFPFSRNTLALCLLARQAPGLNVKCVGVLRECVGFLGLFQAIFFVFCACTAAPLLPSRKAGVSKKSVKYLCIPCGLWVG